MLENTDLILAALIIAFHRWWKGSVDETLYQRFPVWMKSKSLKRIVFRDMKSRLPRDFSFTYAYQNYMLQIDVLRHKMIYLFIKKKKGISVLFHCMQLITLFSTLSTNSEQLCTENLFFICSVLMHMNTYEQLLLRKITLSDPYNIWSF